MSNEEILDKSMENIEGIEAELNKVPEEELEVQSTFNEDPIEILVEDGEIENVYIEEE